MQGFPLDQPAKNALKRMGGLHFELSLRQTRNAAAPTPGGYAGMIGRVASDEEKVNRVSGRMVAPVSIGEVNMCESR